MRTLLIVSGGIEATHGIARAKDMGLRVVVSDINPHAPGFALADDRLLVSTYDAEGTADAAATYAREVGPIHGVICIGADVPLTVATVAHRLGLAGISLASARLAADKLAMKAAFRAAGVPTPWFAPVSGPAELARMVRERGSALVVKPADSRGGRGVQRVLPGADLELIYARAEGASPTRRVLVEAYMDGPQVSTESLMLDGRAHTPGFSDRNYEYLDRFAPWFIENGGDLPSHLPEAIQARVRDVVERAGRALGIVNGNIKGDVVVQDGEPYVIELAARLSGGYFCTREIPLNTGVDFVGAVIRMALGEPVRAEDLIPRFQRPVVQRYVFPAPGRITRIDGIEQARTLAGVEDVIVSLKAGDHVPEATSSAARAAMILTTGATPQAARAAAAAALAAIRVETVP